MKWKDHITGDEFELRLVRISEIEMSPYQRSLSTNLVNKLRNCVLEGFVVPPVCYEENGRLYCIDGQHRIAGLLERVTVDPKIPVIIVPPRLKVRPLIFNTEKADDLKDRCTKVYKLYQDMVENKPELEEAELAKWVGNDPHLFTLGFSWCESNLQYPSLVETAIKKFDGILEGTVGMCVGERRRRGALTSELCELVNKIADEYEFSDYNLKRAVISQSSMMLWGRRRKLGIGFDEGIRMLMAKIEEEDWSRFTEGV